MEQTWGKIYQDNDPRYDFTIGPIREKMGVTEKKSYILVDAEFSKGIMKQLYLHQGDRDAGEIDEAIERIWQE
jgi:hypothetical protein